MQYYPGGSPYGHQSGYRFMYNPLSDLGQIYSWNRSENQISSSLYTPSLMIVGVVVCSLFLLMPRFIVSRWYLLEIAAVCGVASGIALVGLAATPYDWLQNIHSGFLMLWLFPFVLLLVLFVIATLLNRQVPLMIKLVALLLVIIVATYISMSILGWWIKYYVMFQKLVVYGGAIWMVQLGWHFLKQIEQSDQLPDEASAAAMKYSRRSGLSFVMGAVLVSSFVIPYQIYLAAQPVRWYGSRNHPELRYVMITIDGQDHYIHTSIGDHRNLEQFLFRADWFGDGDATAQAIAWRFDWRPTSSGQANGRWVAVVDESTWPENTERPIEVRMEIQRGDQIHYETLLWLPDVEAKFNQTFFYTYMPTKPERRLICSDHFGFGEDAVGNGTSFSVEPASSK